MEVGPITDPVYFLERISYVEEPLQSQVDSFGGGDRAGDSKVAQVCRTGTREKAAKLSVTLSDLGTELSMFLVPTGLHS